MIDLGRDFERIRDYVVGRLSDEEQRAFEDRLLRDPGLVREVEQSLRLSEGLQQLRAQRHFLEDAATRDMGFRLWLPALAASLVAGIALLLWAQPSAAPVLRASLESSSAGAVPLVSAHFTFVATRGDSKPDLDLPPTGLIEFRAAPAARSAASDYTVSLARQIEGQASVPVGTLSGLSLGTDGYLHYYAAAAHLKPGSYVLRINSAGASSDAAQAYTFNLQAGSPH